VTVATVRGRSYYEIVRALKSIGVRYDSMSPEEASLSGAKVIITTREEAGAFAGSGKTVLLGTELEKYPAIAKAKILKTVTGTAADDQLIIGIDPGTRIGISVIYLHEEIASMLESSPQRAVEQVAALVGGISSRKKVVRIGDGNITMARQMAWALKKRFGDYVQVEIVDEHGTSQTAEPNRRGARDRSSARTIAFREGRTFLLSK
jgi:RNase H-fold protein (predicted Holliday junction resolvase)